jgi:hypothetical protein
MMYCGLDSLYKMVINYPLQVENSFLLFTYRNCFGDSTVDIVVTF